MKLKISTNEDPAIAALGDQPAIANNRFSIRLFIVVFFFTAAVLGWLTWSTYNLYTRETTLRERAWHAGELRKQIIHLDEVLTMSARMAATTGDPRWEERYRIFEPKLDQAIKEIMTLTSSQMVVETDAANKKLVEMENQAFTLVRDGDTQRAEGILSSEEYETQKRIYAYEMGKFLLQLESVLSTMHLSQRRGAVFSVGAGIVVLTILLFSGLGIMRSLYKSHAVLIRSITQRNRAEDVLRKAHRELELRVKERTADLTTANTSLKQEIRERKQIEAERQEIESALRDSDERHRALFENANDIIYTHDLAGNYTSVNRVCEEVTGYTAAETLRLNVRQVIAPEFLAFATKMVGRKATEQSPSAYEIEILAKDGRRVTLEVNSQLTFHQGKPFGVQGIARDITERRRAEKERQAISEVIESVSQTSDLKSLFESVHRSLSAVVDAKNCFVALYDDKTKFVEMEFFVDQYDQPPPPQALARSRTAYIFRTGQPMVMTQEVFQLLVKEGEVENQGTLPASWLGVPLATPSGVIGVLVVQHYADPDAYSESDVKFLTSVASQIAWAIERKRGEEALRESEEKYRTILESIEDGYFEVALDGSYSFLNDGFCRITERSEEELLGHSYKEFFAADLAKRLKDAYSGVYKTGKPLRAFEYAITRKDGTKKFVEESVTLQRNAAGHAIGFMGIRRDCTERKKIGAELENARDAALESARLKSEFLANMSHEIRTPMNGVIGMTGLLLDTDLNAEQREFAETIQSSGDGLLTIINDILDFSKIEAGKLQFEILDFDLSNAVEGAVELLAERARDKKIELASLIYSDVTTKLQGDPGRLRQVLTNLLGNAVKFTEHGEVILRAEKESETVDKMVVRFSVSDTGIGINEAARRTLFQAFTQADGSTTRKYGGTGLGLAISKQLVELMGGEIGVDSVPGQGSSFWFTASFAKQLNATAKTHEVATGISGLHALIVDDNATNRKILSHQLSSWGLTHQESESGAQALELLHAAVAEGHAYDLAILDLMMPGMDGFELARRIKSDPLLNATHLVMLTSYGLRGDGTTARELGVAAYLTKPIRQSHLFECLTSVVSRSSIESGKDPASPGKAAQLITRHVLKETNTMPDRLILLAEDNIVNQKVAVRQLQKLGYRADAVANGREAVEALKRIPYDVVLMDCQMPEMDGYEATAEIRRLEGQTKHTMIIAMTANALHGDREKCIEAGMDDYISKPVKSVDLAQVLQRVFAGSLNQETVSCAPEEILPPVDMARLHEAMGDELFEILDIYLAQTSDNLGKLLAAIAAGSASEVDLIAHNCAGTSANCGMVAMVQPLRELERMGREGSLAGAEALGRQVSSEFERVKGFLEENLAQVAV